MACRPDGWDDEYVSSHLALVLPGQSYGPSGPALRFPALALRQLDAEVRVVPYPSARPTDLGLEAGRSFFEAVRQSAQEIIDGADWDRVTFIAKSLGTVALSVFGTQLKLPDQVSAIWLTPLFHLDYVRRGALASRWRSLVVCGDADPSYDAPSTELVVAGLGAEELVLPGAAHSLEVESDVLATLDRMQQLAHAVLRFGRPSASDRE